MNEEALVEWKTLPADPDLKKLYDLVANERLVKKVILALFVTSTLLAHSLAAEENKTVPPVAMSQEYTEIYGSDYHLQFMILSRPAL